MSKKSINHRYTIEYVHPASISSSKSVNHQTDTHTVSKKGILLLFLLFASLLAGLSYLYKKGTLKNYLQYQSVSNNSSSMTREKNKEVIAPEITAKKDFSEPEAISKQEATNKQKIVVSNKATTKQSASQTSASQKNTANTQKIEESADVVITARENPDNEKLADELNQDAPENARLLNSLDDLTEQLLEARRKNAQLQNKLKENQNKTDNLANLLEESLKEAKPEDQQYIKALQNLDEEKTEEQATEIDSGENTLADGAGKKAPEKNTIAAKPAVEATNEDKNVLNYNNAISLNMKSQVDAIILAMKNNNLSSGTNRKNKTSTNLQSKNDDLINQLSKQLETKGDSKSSKTDENLITVGLQGKINKLITSKELTSSDYKKALSQESRARSNAVRSVIVKRGETLWSIAKRAYGNGFEYKKILKANPQLSRRKNFRLIIGQVIRVPE